MGFGAGRFMLKRWLRAQRTPAVPSRQPPSRSRAWKASLPCLPAPWWLLRMLADCSVCTQYGCAVGPDRARGCVVSRLFAAVLGTGAPCSHALDSMDWQQAASVLTWIDPRFTAREADVRYMCYVYDQNCSSAAPTPAGPVDRLSCFAPEQVSRQPMAGRVRLHIRSLSENACNTIIS